MKLIIPDSELQSQRLSAQTLAQAYRTFTAKGALLMENVWSRDFMQTVADEFGQYTQVEPNENQPGCLRVGNKRYMFSLKFQGALASPELYVNPFIMSVIYALMGEDFVLDNLGAVSAFPGAEKQHLHADHPALFDEDQVSTILPPHAITVVAPLCDLDPECGTTAIWEGSHRDPNFFPKHPHFQDMVSTLNERADMPGATLPYPKLGDCYLMDYRVWHCGTPNNSNHQRNILYLAYARSWFRDAHNHEEGLSLFMDQAEYDRIPEDCKLLFRFANVLK